MKPESLQKKAVVVLAHGLTLFLGLYGTAFCFITGFSLSADYAAMGTACLLLTVLFTALFALSRRWHRALLLALLVLGLGWWVWSSRSDLYQGGLLAAKQVGELFIAAFGLNRSIDLSGYVGELTAAEECRVVTMFLFALFTLVGCLLGDLIGRGRSFWGMLACTAPFLLAALANTATPDWLPLVMLLLFWSLGLLGRYTRKGDPYGAAKQTLWTLPAALALLVGLRLFISASDPGRENLAQRARFLAADWVTLAGQNIVSASGTGTIFSAAATGEIELSDAGPLRFTGRTVLRVEGDTTGRIYLRGLSSAVYDGSWGPLDDGAYEVLDGEPGIWEHNTDILYADGRSPADLEDNLGGIGDYQPLNFPAMADQGGPSTRVVVENMGAPAGYVYTPYQLTTTPERMTGAEFVRDAYLARGAGVWKHVLYARDQANPDHGKTLAGEAAAAELAYRAFVYEHYTQVPRDLENTLDTLLQRAGIGLFLEQSADGGQLYDPPSLARAVAAYLADSAVYDPETPVTPRGEDFVAYFLTESHRGYCMHFASAATLMLRAMGVPARYTAGYVANTVAGERVDVPDYNAHAWVEVYCDGYGWQPVEVTPGFDGDYPWERRTDSAASAATPAPTASPTATPVPTPDDERLPRPSAGPGGQGTEREAGGAPALWWLLVPAVPALAALGFALRRSLAAKRRGRQGGGPDVNASAVALYSYGRAVMDFRSLEEVDERVEELARRARFSQHILTEEEHTYIRDWALGLAEETDRRLKWSCRLLFRYWKGLY